MNGQKNESDGHIALPANVFYLLLCGIAGGGAGINGFIQPKLTTEAVEACYDNSKVALEVAAQHGQELQNIRNSLIERTQYRYTSENAQKDWAEHERFENLQNRRLDHIESRMSE